MSNSPSMSRGSIAFLAIGLVAAALSSHELTDARFAVIPAVAPSETKSAEPLFASIDLPRPTPTAHASSMAFMHDGSLLIAWFGGTREGAGDVAIQMAKVKDGRVQDSWTSLTCDQLEALTHRVIRTLGNPVLWVDTNGRMCMCVVSVSYGGWSGSAVNQLQSDDGGRSWSKAHRLILSPLFNFSTLVRNQTVAMEDGTIGLPAYHEFLHKWGTWVRMNAAGRVLQCDRMHSAAGEWLQPAVAATSATEAVAVLRSANITEPVIGQSATRDGGQTWLMKAPLDIPNPNSSVSMIRLADGSLLIAANPLVTGRNVLQLFRSHDGGAHWSASRTIERGEKGGEFSYPFFAQSVNGMIQLSYTWQRKGIRLCVFNTRWLDTDDTESPPMENTP